MRYYLITQDKGYIKVPKILDAYKVLSLNNTKPPSAKNLERRTIITMKAEEDTVYTDILTGSLFLVSETMKECMELFEPNLKFKEIILLEQTRREKQHYFLPQLQELDCLTENSEYGFGHMELTKIEIAEEKLKDKAIFRIAGMEKDYIIARLDMVESLLRRGIKGMALEEVQVRKYGKEGGISCQKKNSIW